MTTQPCPRCPRLEAENAALRQRVARLETSLSRARSVIEHQKRWKGRGEVAGDIYGQISTDWGTGMLAEIASLLGM